jgi:outer membrane protein assembly factor BamE (lipoprotein component of BamABCDE complex)
MIWLGVLLVVMTLSAGCGETVLTQWPKGAIFSSYFRLQELRPGMDRPEVEGIMGAPMIREEGDYRGGHYVFYFYRTYNMDYDGSETVRGGYTPLVFQNDKLVGIGKSDYRRAVDRPEFEPPPDLPWRRTQ